MLRRAASRPGLFGIIGLHSPNDFQQLARETRARCEALVHEVVNAPPGVQVVQLMDELSNEICKTFDAAECCRNIHSSQQWKAAADEVCQQLGAYIAEVNQHDGMYRKLLAAVPHIPDGTAAAAGTASQGATAASWRQGEAHLVASRLLGDFEGGGVGLQEPAKRQRVQQLAPMNHHFPVLFNRNLADAAQLGTVRIRGSQGPQWQRVPLDSPSINSFLIACPDSDTRKQVWQAGHRVPTSNLVLLDHMIASRHEMASLLGQPSYCHLRAANGTLAQTPATAVEFLHHLSDAAHDGADDDVAELARLKARSEPGGALEVGVWDAEHLMAKARRAAMAVAPSAISEYMELEGVLQGLQQLVRRLLGLEMTVGPVGESEGWARGLLKVTASHPDMGPMGTLYLDLASRPGKAQGSMLFPVRCGKELGPGEYQQPILVLCCDFGTAPAGAPERLVLSWRDLRVLLHEMGHALHSLCSRTAFQHLWGTRCAVDLMEVPSHLFELFALEPATAQLLLRSRSTGQPLPAAMHRALLQVHGMFAHLELQGQILLALVDQQYFGPSPPARGHTSAAWHQLAARHSSLTQLPGTSPEARFTHLALYGGTYYCYMYARCLAASIWQHYGLESDPMNASAGEAVRRLLLEPGGGKDPHMLVEDLLGHSGGLALQSDGWAPCPDAYMRLIQRFA